MLDFFFQQNIFLGDIFTQRLLMLYCLSSLTLKFYVHGNLWKLYYWRLFFFFILLLEFQRSKSGSLRGWPRQSFNM